MRRGLLLLAFFTSTLAFAPVALADTVNFTLASPSQTAASGSVIAFTGTLSAPATNGADVYLNGDSFSTSLGLTLDDSDYFANTPLFLTPGETFTGSLFNVNVSAAGSGSFSLLGGATGDTADLLASQNFSVNIATSVTPEPSSLLLFATGAAALCALSLRRRVA